MLHPSQTYWYIRRGIAVGIAAIFAFSSFPGIAAACEGASEELTSEQENLEGIQNNPSGFTYHVRKIAKETLSIDYGVEGSNKVELKAFTKEKDTTNWSYKELANCENKTFNPGKAVCKFKVELVNVGATEGVLKLAYKFVGGMEKTYEMKFVTP